MFARTLHVTYKTDEAGPEIPVPLAWLDSFAMRNFTNNVEFDDLLPVEVGRLEAGYRVPLPALTAALEAWLRRKSWLSAGMRLRIRELDCPEAHTDPPGSASYPCKPHLGNTGGNRPCS